MILNYYDLPKIMKAKTCWQFCQNYFPIISISFATIISLLEPTL